MLTRLAGSKAGPSTTHKSRFDEFHKEKDKLNCSKKVPQEEHVEDKHKNNCDKTQ